jgi:Diacylglycerol acyltransferase
MSMTSLWIFWIFRSPARRQWGFSKQEINKKTSPLLVFCEKKRHFDHQHHSHSHTIIMAPKKNDLERRSGIVRVTETDPTSITVRQKLLGALSLGLFVIVWISSIGSPLLLAMAIVRQRYMTATCIGGIFVLAYLPWKKENVGLARAIHKMIQTNTPLYFQSLKIHLVQPSQQQQQQQQPASTFYAIHPHGCFCMGWGQLFCHDTFRQVRFCFSPALYASPFFRLFARCTGHPGSASKSSMSSYLKNGQDLALPPGGFEEATLSCTTQDRVFIQKRTGFIRLCLQYGYAVRPVYCFGENRLYWNIQGMEKFRLALNRYGIPTILAWGQAFIPVLPKRNVDLHIVVGAPIALPTIPNPTQAEVQTWHAIYVTELVKLFEEHKEAAYGADVAKTAKLQVW